MKQWNSFAQKTQNIYPYPRECLFNDLFLDNKWANVMMSDKI